MGLRNFFIIIFLMSILLGLLITKRSSKQRHLPGKETRLPSIPSQKHDKINPPLMKTDESFEVSKKHLITEKKIVASMELEQLLKQFLSKFDGGNSQDQLIISLTSKIIDLIKQDTEDILILTLNNASDAEVKKQLIHMIVDYDYTKHHTKEGKFNSDILYRVRYRDPLSNEVRELLSNIVLNKREEPSVRAEALRQFIITFDKKILDFIIDTLSFGQNNELRTASLQLASDYLECWRQQHHYPDFKELDVVEKSYLLNQAEKIFSNETDEELKARSIDVLRNDYLRNDILLEAYSQDSRERVRNSILYALCGQLKYACNDFQRRLIDRQTLLNVAGNIVPFLFNELVGRERKDKSAVIYTLGDERLSMLQEFRSQILEKLIGIATTADSNSKEAAIRALGKGGYVEALDFLKKLAETEKNEEIKDACQDAIERLTRFR